MKKIVCLILMVVILAVAATGCGNMSMGFGNFTFTKIHVDTYHYSGCLELEKYQANTRGIEFTTEDFGSFYLSEGTYTLIEDECPFCDSGK